MGAIPPARWQNWQCSWRIGAMSFSNVTWGGPPPAPADVANSKTAYKSPAAITAILFARIFRPPSGSIPPEEPHRQRDGEQRVDSHDEQAGQVLARPGPADGQPEAGHIVGGRQHHGDFLHPQ